MTDHFQDDQLISYLLGGLSAGEQASLEQKYFQDDEYFEYLRAVEDDLIDRFLRRELNWLQNRRFKRYYLNSPVRRARVESARALMQAILPAGSRRKHYSWPARYRIFVLVWGCAALILITSLCWSIWRNVSLQKQLAIANLVLKQARRDLVRASSPEPLAISFQLSRIQRNFASGNRLILPVDVQNVNFLVDVSKPGEGSYSATFTTPEGDQIGTSTDITTRISQGTAIATVKAPAAIFVPGTYILTLRAGVQDLRSYSFTIARQ